MSIVIGGQCRRPARSMVLPLRRGREPPRPRCGAIETPGRVQPHSLLRESVTGGDLQSVSLASYRQTRAPPCATLDHRWGVRKPGRDQGARGTLAVPSATMTPLPGERAQRRLPGRGPTSMQRLAPCGAGEGKAPDPSHAAPSALPPVGAGLPPWGLMGAPTRVQVEAPCSALAFDTVPQ